MKDLIAQILNRLSRPGDRTCRPPQKNGLWITGAFIIAYLAGMVNDLTIFGYYLHPSDPLAFALGPGRILWIPLSFATIGIAKSVGTRKIIFINFFFVFTSIIVPLYLVGFIFFWFAVLTAPHFWHSDAVATFLAPAILNTVVFWIVIRGYYHLATTPWWQPWAHQDAWLAGEAARLADLDAAATRLK